MTCPLCDRDVPETLLQRHHLKTKRKDKAAIEKVCRECHKTIHGLFPHKELRDPRTGLDTLEGIREHPEFQKAVQFIRKVRPGSFMRMRSAKRRR